MFCVIKFADGAELMAKTFTWADYEKMIRKPRISKSLERKITASVRRDVAYMKAMFCRGSK